MNRIELIEKVKSDISKVKPELDELLEQKLHDYDSRYDFRIRNKIPVLAFCGYGRAGKDLAGEWLSTNSNVKYTGSISNTIKPFVAIALNKTEEEVFAARHENRMYWFEFCNELRRNDPSLLVLLTLAENDVVCGIRSCFELDAVKRTGIIDLSVWIQNRRSDVDQTVEYTEEDCDITVTNNGSKLEYYEKLYKLCNLIDFKLK